MGHRILVAAFTLACLLVPAAPASAEPPSYYPPLTYVPAAVGNYDVGRRGVAISAIVIHETEAPYSSVLYWFRKPGSEASAHYLVRAYDGAITQFVAESDSAYHARSANKWTIGIEHEFGVRFGIGHTDVQYRSSAALVCAIAHRYGIPLDRQHILGHNELPGNDHRDPGPFWNWTYYMSLVRACGAPADDHVSASSAPDCDTCLGFGDEGDEVALLQTRLVSLGFLDEDDLAGGEGTFGPRTLSAVKAFQEAYALEATGTYDEPSAAALDKVLAEEAARQVKHAMLLEVAALIP